MVIKMGIIKDLYLLCISLCKRVLFPFLSLGMVILAGVTLIPSNKAHKLCLLGYKAHCSFTPYSTAILLFLAGIFALVTWRYNKKRRKK
jgi:hypothetical protein